MNLYILRHGLATELGEKGIRRDEDRPLTAKGRQRLGRITKAMARLELEFDWILSSPLVRAAQTAAIVAEAQGLTKKLEFTNHLRPAGDPRDLIEQITQQLPQAENILLVGHEPYLSKLIAHLIAGNSNLQITLKKAGLCRLEVEKLVFGRCAALAWLLTPRQLEQMAESA